MQNEPKYQLVEFPPDKGQEITRAVQKLIENFGGQLVITPVINPNGTLGAKAEIFKRVELVPKGEPSPIMKDGKFIEPDQDEGTKPVKKT